MTTAQAQQDARQTWIDEAFAQKEELSSEQINCVFDVIRDMDQGRLRVAMQKQDGSWQLNEWLKKAVLLFFRIQPNKAMFAGELHFWDKVPVKAWNGTEGVRVVPPAVVRQGAYIEKGCVLMPCYVNIGAYVASGTMVDTWATVGSCAQIGKNVHLSGGVGIGGVLEPLQAKPVIVEDNVFVGSRCIVVEGAHLEESCVLGAGVTITGTSKIINTQNGEVYTGRVPKNSVVIPGSLPKEFSGGTYHVPCALILGERKPSTDLKTSLNQALREFSVSV